MSNVGTVSPRCRRARGEARRDAAKPRPSTSSCCSKATEPMVHRRAAFPPPVLVRIADALAHVVRPGRPWCFPAPRTVLVAGLRRGEEVARARRAPRADRVAGRAGSVVTRAEPGARLSRGASACRPSGRHASPAACSVPTTRRIPSARGALDVPRLARDRLPRRGAPRDRRLRRHHRRQADRDRDPGPRAFESGSHRERGEDDDGRRSSGAGTRATLRASEG